MHADNDAYKAGDKESHFANYMKSNYPEIVDFIVTSSKEISFDNEESAISFRLGAMFAVAAHYQRIETEDLPRIT